jgi:hypothetical protein
MRIHLITDTHNYGPKWDGTSVESMIAFSEEKKKLGEETYLLGDIIDAARCLKGDVAAAKRDFFRLSLHFQEKYIQGNHELKLRNMYSSKYWTITEYEKEHYLLLTHLHRCEYSPAKIADWENRTIKGISHKKWMALKLGYEFKQLVYKNKSKLSNKQISAYLKHVTISDAHVTLVGGHKHPDKLIDESYYIEKQNTEVRIVVCPVGYSTIEV